MSGCPPTDPAERPGPPPTWPPGRVLVLLMCALSAIGCGGLGPSTSSAPVSALATDAGRLGVVDGLVVLTGGRLTIGTPDGLFVGIDGPDGQVAGFAAAAGRLVARSTVRALAVADVDRNVLPPPPWRTVEVAAIEGRRVLSGPAISASGDRIALITASVAGDTQFDAFVVDLATRDADVTHVDRQANGPPVWIDEKRLLLEVLPIPGGTGFIRLDLATGHREPVIADGYGPAISGDGSVLAVASTDGSVVAVPAAGWLGGDPPVEGAIVDTSGTPFQLAIDFSGTRIAIGYADEAGDPAVIAVFVRDGPSWRQSGSPVPIVAGTLTMLGWLN